MKKLAHRRMSKNFLCELRTVHYVRKKMFLSYLLNLGVWVMKNTHTRHKVIHKKSDAYCQDFFFHRIIYRTNFSKT